MVDRGLPRHDRSANMGCMASAPRPAGDAAPDHIARAIQIGDRSAQLIALSDAARAQLHTLGVPAEFAAEAGPDAVGAKDTALSQQMSRRHVLVVNSDPAFLDAVRVMLQSNRYNVTSTNLVAQTF